MEIFDLELEGIKLIYPDIYGDDRGFFLETYSRSKYVELGISTHFLQDNLSFSKQGTIRGMHFQSSPGQTKLIQVLQGEILDVVVDLREDSKTFKQWMGVTLEETKKAQLLIPHYFAHGFCVISKTALVKYKVSSEYNPETEKGFAFDDPEIGINWPENNPHLSQRDQKAPKFAEVMAELKCIGS